MPEISQGLFRERVVDTMIELARLREDQRIIEAGSNALEIYLGLHRRGFTRTATTATCRIPCGQHDVALVAGWHSMRGLEDLIARLAHFMHAAATLAVWIDADEHARSEKIRSLLERWGFHIEAGTRCGDGYVLSARRRERLADAA